MRVDSNLVIYFLLSAIFSDSFVSDADFLVDERESLNFRKFKAMNVGLSKYNGSCTTCTEHMPSLCAGLSRKITSVFRLV